MSIILPLIVLACAASQSGGAKTIDGQLITPQNLKLQDDGEIIWSKTFIMTRMAGPPELMQQEADFTQALMQTSRIILNDSKLVLMSDDRSNLLEFEQAP